MTTDWKTSLNLPQTPFPMKANLTQREPEMLARWEKEGIYKRIQEARKEAPVFSFHDGPPYANGHIHLGHALNKILKDFVVKSRSMSGYRVTYRPGWDCHGLPIELQIEKEQGRKVRDMEIHAFRKACRAYAEKFIEAQRREFVRLGVFGEWENPYKTMDYSYEAAIASSFIQCFQKGYAYKGMKSVQWCIHCETALAEAEVEYQEHTSPTVHVAFPLAPGQRTKLPEGVPDDARAVIWTTTPWTLPANLAIAFHPDFIYVAAKCGNDNYIVAEALLPAFLEETGLNGKVVAKFRGAQLEGVRFRHPFLDRDSVGILAPYVTSDTGTGCVHTAPGHGQEDYISGVRYGLPILSPVDGKGIFLKEVEHFSGQNVFDANPKVIEILREKGALLHSGSLRHSYPHCWRCKNPLIFRATKQWFMQMEHDALRQRALEAIDATKWVPPWGRNRIYGMVENRPDWCVSRQRRWGVPITVVSCASCEEPVREQSFFDEVVKEINERGAGIWWEGDASRFLPEGYICPKCGGNKFIQETDILDVWFDSGVSHRAVLKDENHPWPSEIYLEGSDQHRGWFHTSLLTALMLNGSPPYKQVVTHGFVLDGEGRAMSKSMGNVIAPEEVVKKAGAEILRLWVSMVDYRDDVRFSWDLIGRNSEAYLKIRNTLRYLLGNLYDFDPAKDMAAPEAMGELDQYVLLLLDRLIERITKAYEEMAFHVVYHEALQFCAVTLSAFYLDILKDRLYCSKASSPERRSAQTVLYRCADALLRLLAPVLPFTMEEAWGQLAGRECPSVHMALFPKPFGLSDDGLAERWEKLRAIRDTVNKALEEARRRGEIGKSLEAKVVLRTGDESVMELLESHRGILPEVFIVSSVDIQRADGGETAAEVLPALGEKCQRCWVVTTEPQAIEGGPLCPRCARATQ